MAKRLSKTLWYGTGLDTYGKPLLPPVATNESDLNGLHRGELFMHLDKDNVTLWALSSNNEVVQIAGKQGEIDIDLSDYLLKSTWDKIWELRKDNNGVEYIYSKLPVVTRYGITMYADNGEVEVESIYAGLPIDRQTLIWKDGVLMVNPELDLGNGGGIDENELRDYLTRNDYAKKSDITTALSGYATTSSLNAVSTKLNDFLEGSDTDTVINKWKELETFLSGLTESDNLATILTGKADKSYVDTNFVTIAGTEDVTGLHNFVNGLKIGGIEIVKKQDDVVYLDGNLVVRGGITMYGDGEGGSSAPLYSTLGSLLNVDESNDAVASVDRVLFQSAGSNVWSWKALSEIGGGSSGGSVSGDYLPLSGGTITGNLLIKQPTTTPVVGFIGSANSGTSYYYYGYLGFEAQNNPIFMNSQGSTYPLLHSGNISSYNAGSATKLQTARTIWGQSFDGTGNVGGNIYMDNNVSLLWKQTDGNYVIGMQLSTSNNLTIGTQTAQKGYDTYISGNKVYLRYGTSQMIGLLLNSDGKVGIGTTSPTQPLHVVGNIATYVPSTNDQTASIDLANTINDRWQISGRFNKNKDTENNKLNIYYYNGSTWDTKMTLQTNGNVGIGTRSPAYKLDVNGTIRFASKTIWGQSFDGTGDVSGDIYLNNSNFIRVADTSGTSRKILTLDDGNNVVLGYHTADASYDTYIDGLNIHIRSGKHNEVLHINSSGKVGIGITSPTEKLDINGHMIIRGAGDNLASINLYNSSTSLWQISARFTSSDKNLKFYYYNGSAYNTYLTISQSGGNMLVAGGITMYSDQRKKTILNHVELSLKQIADAPLIEHYYNSDQDKTTHVGSIAQYWAELNDWFCKLDNEGFYTMEIQNCALASAISIARHLERYESKTDKTIRKMKKRIQELEDEVERLKQN